MCSSLSRAACARAVASSCARRSAGTSITAAAGDDSRLVQRSGRRHRDYAEGPASLLTTSTRTAATPSRATAAAGVARITPRHEKTVAARIAAGTSTTTAAPIEARITALSGAGCPCRTGEAAHDVARCRTAGGATPIAAGTAIVSGIGTDRRAKITARVSPLAAWRTVARLAATAVSAVATVRAANVRAVAVVIVYPHLVGSGSALSIDATAIGSGRLPARASAACPGISTAAPGARSAGAANQVTVDQREPCTAGHCQCHRGRRLRSGCGGTQQFEVLQYDIGYILHTDRWQSAGGRLERRAIA